MSDVRDDLLAAVEKWKAEAEAAESRAAEAEERLAALRRGIEWIAGGGQPLTPDTMRRLLEGNARPIYPDPVKGVLDGK